MLDRRTLILLVVLVLYSGRCFAESLLRTPSEVAVPGIYYGVPGAAFDRITNDAPAINAQINKAYAAGGGTIYLPSGTTAIGAPGIILRSFVKLVAQGTATTVICNVSPCVTQALGSQLFDAALNNIAFKSGRGQASATVLSLSSAQYSEFGRFYFSGFTTGTLLNISGVPVTSFDNATVGQNIIFNSFHDWVDWSGSENGLVIAGKYGSSPPSPLSGGMVVTLNSFSNIAAKVSKKCVDLIADVDTNSFVNTICRFSENGAQGIVQGDDPAYSTVNTYVNDNKFFGLTFSNNYDVTSSTLFSGNYSFGTEVYGLSHDIASGKFTLNSMTLDRSHCFRGVNIDSRTTNTLMSEDCYNVSRKGRTLVQAPKAPFEILGTVTAGYDILYIGNLTELRNGTIELPCNARDGDEFEFVSYGGVKSVTVAVCSGSADNIIGNPTNLRALAPLHFRYVQSSRYWIPK